MTLRELLQRRIVLRPRQRSYRAVSLPRTKLRLVAGAVFILLIILSVSTVLDRWYATRSSLVVADTRAATSVDSTAVNISEVRIPTSLSLFGERIPLENWEVRERFEREFYYNLGNADQILLYWKRAQRIFPRIEAALRKAGIPEDFKYLMVAESGLRNVKSIANANGYWQFIPGTGMKYGLRIDDLIDERLDPYRSTEAAILYILKMKAELPSWTLVAAGYNMSEDNVLQAMEWQHQSSYWNLFVNDETMRYILRIAVIKELMEHGGKYGIDFGHAIPFRDPQFRTVTVQGPLPSLSDWAQQQGYSYKDVKIFNPSFIGRSLPEGIFTVRLPATDLDRTTQ